MVGSRRGVLRAGGRGPRALHGRLRRAVARAGRRAREASIEALTRVEADAGAVARAFFPGREDPSVAGVIEGLSDRHRGRSVAQVRFAHGGAAYLKPRDVAADAAFRALLDELHDRGLRPRLRAPAVLARDGYGWVEAVRPAACAGREEVREFFLRAGLLLGVLTALDGVDAHMENVVAAGPDLVLVDAETLLHPRAVRVAAEGRVREVDDGRDGPLEPRRTGLLPSPRRAGARWIDGSGLAGRRPRRGPDGAAGRAPGVPRALALRAGLDACRPLLLHRATGPDGRAVSPAEHAAELEAGFRRACLFLGARRAALQEPGGALDALARSARRVVLQRTRDLHAVLARSLAAACRGSPSARARALRRAALCPVAVRLAEGAEPAHAVTARALAGLEIPRFVLHPAGGDPLDAARRRLVRLEPAAIDGAAAAIRASLAALVVALGPRESRSPPG